MNKISKILEGSKILAITDKSGREYHFIGSKEREKVSAKMTYYLWLSRFFVVTSAASLLLFLAVWILRLVGVSFDGEESGRIFRLFTEYTPLDALKFLGI